MSFPRLRSVAGLCLISAVLVALPAQAQKGMAVDQTFRVRVLTEGRPRANVLITVQQGRWPQPGPVIRSATTGRNGEVLIEEVPPGEYTVRTGEWDRNDVRVVQVKRGGGKPSLVTLNWPGLVLLRTREFRGTFHESGVRITVFTLNSGERVGSTVTDKQGRFAMPNVRNGEYLLRLLQEEERSSLQIRGDVAVVVDKRAPAAEIDVFPEMDRGSLSYGAFCHLPMRVKVTHLCGQVTDEHGARLAGVRVGYLDRAGRRRFAITDTAGKFNISGSVALETSLEITGNGYIPLKATGIRTGQQKECERPIRITLPKEINGYGCRSVRGID